MNRWVLAAMRQFMSAIDAMYLVKWRSLIRRITISSSDGSRISVLIVRPTGLRVPAPALIYCHGGAFVMKYMPQHLANAVRYAHEADCLVVFVEYRLAPQDPFPAGFNDCYGALGWSIANAGDLGIDPSRLAVGGDSAGGCLAAAVAQRAKFESDIELRGQLLIYPVVDLQCDRSSTTLYANVPPFKNTSAAAMTSTYLGRPPGGTLPRYASPLDGELSGLAPAYVETAQFDLLHDQAAAYVEAMKEKAVEVEHNEVMGGVHGFDLLAPTSSVALAAMKRRIGFLCRVFGSR